MKKIITVLFLVIMSHLTYAQGEKISADTILSYFDEVKQAAQEHYALWNRSVYGAMLLIDAKTRQVYANEPDEKRALTLKDGIYCGLLPYDINIANTSIEWNGKTWALITLPLSKNRFNRINLLAHERFHCIQPSLGFTPIEKPNNHLDKKDGRIYLRLELEALRHSVNAQTPNDAKKHIANALIFRIYRHSMFKGAAASENLLEINEGIAEYTGFVISGMGPSMIKSYFEKEISSFLKNPSFVRSFAYATTPIYGYHLAKSKKYWNREVSQNVNLTDYFAKEFGVETPKNLFKAVAKASKMYDAKTIIAEENEREQQKIKLVAAYKSKFIEKLHTCLATEDMSVSFNPQTLVPLEDKGTVYPSMRAVDKWGVLTVSNGALLNPSWTAVYLSAPTSITDTKVEGDGWVLELNEHYSFGKKDDRHYGLTKK